MVYIFCIIPLFFKFILSKCIGFIFLLWNLPSYECPRLWLINWQLFWTSLNQICFFSHCFANRVNNIERMSSLLYFLLNVATFIIVFIIIITTTTITTATIKIINKFIKVKYCLKFALSLPVWSESLTLKNVDVYDGRSTRWSVCFHGCVPPTEWIS